MIFFTYITKYRIKDILLQKGWDTNLSPWCCWKDKNHIIAAVILLQLNPDNQSLNTSLPRFSTETYKTSTVPSTTHVQSFSMSTDMQISATSKLRFGRARSPCIWFAKPEPQFLKLVLQPNIFIIHSC